MLLVLDQIIDQLQLSHNFDLFKILFTVGSIGKMITHDQCMFLGISVIKGKKCVPPSEQVHVVRMAFHNDLPETTGENRHDVCVNSARKSHK